ncbi:hypothetical protein cypCar_00022560 [Cyprinus carpio]|nr:hypothetical protein cypCar_00022560 [Cyprinus carpio]
MDPFNSICLSPSLFPFAQLSSFLSQLYADLTAAIQQRRSQSWDSPTANESGAKTARSKASSRFPRPGRNSGREARNPEPQSGDL